MEDKACLFAVCENDEENLEKAKKDIDKSLTAINNICKFWFVGELVFVNTRVAEDVDPYDDYLISL